MTPLGWNILICFPVGNLNLVYDFVMRQHPLERQEAMALEWRRLTAGYLADLSKVIDEEIEAKVRHETTETMLNVVIKD